MEIPISLLIIEKFLFVLAFGLAVKQMQDSKHQITKLQNLVADLNKQSQHLNQIEKSLSTRYIGMFPDYISELASFVTRTQKTLKILCDFPGYGAFSNQKAFHMYEEAINKQIDDNPHFKMNFICVNSELRDKLNSFQFPFDEVKWKEWKASKSELLRRFVKKYAGPQQVDLEKLELTDFKKYLEACDLKLLNDVFRDVDNVTVKQTSDLIPIYCWIRDDEDTLLLDAEALIVFRSFVEIDSEFCFLTKDPKIIKAVMGIFNSAKSDSTPSHSVLNTYVELNKSQ